MLNKAELGFIGRNGNKDLRKFNEDYDQNTITYLIHLQAPQSCLKYVFKTGITNHFIQQILWLNMLASKFKCPALFITPAPAEMDSSHFVCGVLYQNKLLLINPLGAKLNKDLVSVLHTISKQDDQKIFERIYISTDVIQKDPEGQSSCGPLCVELIKELNAKYLKIPKLFAQWSSLPDEKMMEKDELRYFAVSVSNYCVSEALSSMKKENAVDVMQGIRARHLETLTNMPTVRLLNEHEMESPSLVQQDKFLEGLLNTPEQVLVWQLAEDQLRLDEFEININYQQLQARFSPKQKVHEATSASPQAFSSGSSINSTPTLLRPKERGEEWELDVPSDGSCLFWAAALSYLLPVLNKPEFHERYRNLFGEEEHLDLIKQMLRKYDPQATVISLFQNDTMNHLIRHVFRSRVIDYMAEEKNKPHFSAYHPEDHGPYDNYLIRMRNSTAWGGELEIKAISLLLSCNIVLEGVGAVQNYPEKLNETFPTIKLVSVNAGNHVGGAKNHYRFTLAQDELRQQVINSTQSNLNNFQRDERRPALPPKLSASPNRDQSDPQILKRSLIEKRLQKAAKVLGCRAEFYERKERTNLSKVSSCFELFEHLLSILELTLDDVQKNAVVSVISSKEKNFQLQELQNWYYNTIQLPIDLAQKSGNPEPICFFKKFEQMAAENPDSPAILYRDKEMTYGKLNRRADRLACQLINLAKENLWNSGDPIAIFFENSPETVITLLAIMKAGLSYVPLTKDPKIIKERLVRYLEESEAKYLIIQDTLIDHPITDFIRDRCPTLKNISFTELCDSATKIEPKMEFNIEVSTEQCAYTIFSSGTTGVPKGIMVAHRGLLNAVKVTDKFIIKQHDRVGWYSLLTFDASLLDIMTPLSQGASLVIIPQEIRTNKTLLNKYLIENKVNFITMVPSAAKMLDLDNLPDLHGIISTGEAGNNKLYEDLRIKGRDGKPPRIVIIGYGPTENTIATSEGVFDTNDIVNIGTLPLPGMKWFIAKFSDENNPFPREPELITDETEGELYLSGIGVALGYVRKRGTIPPDYHRRFRAIPDPQTGKMIWIYQTGDVVKRSNGKMIFIGRRDKQVKYNGEQLDLNAIEAALREFTIENKPIFEEVAVLYFSADLTQGRSFPTIRAYLQLQKNIEDKDHLIRQLNFYLRHHDYCNIPPTSYSFIDLNQWPTNQNQKTDEEELRKRDVKSYYCSPAFQLQFDNQLKELQSEISQIWYKTLNILPSDLRLCLEHNFIELSSNSMCFLAMLYEVEREYKINLDITEFIAWPTLRSLIFRASNEIFKRTNHHVVEWGQWELGGFTFDEAIKSGKFPIILVNSVTGRADQEFRLVSQELKTQLSGWPFLYMQSGGLTNPGYIVKSVPELARDYIRSLYADTALAINRNVPIILISYSAGGTLAYEMAWQLQNIGRTVAVCLIDTLRSYYYKRLPQSEYAVEIIKLMTHMLPVMKLPREILAKFSTEALARYGKDEQLSIVWQVLMEEYNNRLDHNIDKDREKERLLGHYATLHNLVQTQLSYTPKPIKLATLITLSETREKCDNDERLCWGGELPINIERVEGEHKHLEIVTNGDLVRNSIVPILKRVCQSLYSVDFKAEQVRAKYNEDESRKVLKHIMLTETEELCSMLLSAKKILYTQCDFIDSSNRRFPKITPFQYAVWTSNMTMITLLRKYLPPVDAAHQFWDLITNRLDIIKEHGCFFDFNTILSQLTKFINAYDQCVFEIEHYGIMPIQSVYFGGFISGKGELEIYLNKFNQWSEPLLQKYWVDAVMPVAQSLPNWVKFPTGIDKMPSIARVKRLRSYLEELMAKQWISFNILQSQLAEILPTLISVDSNTKMVKNTIEEQQTFSQSHQASPLRPKLNECPLVDSPVSVSALAQVIYWNTLTHLSLDNCKKLDESLSKALCELKTLCTLYLKSLDIKELVLWGTQDESGIHSALPALNECEITACQSLTLLHLDSLNLRKLRLTFVNTLVDIRIRCQELSDQCNHYHFYDPEFYNVLATTFIYQHPIRHYARLGSVELFWGNNKIRLSGLDYFRNSKNSGVESTQNNLSRVEGISELVELYPELHALASGDGTQVVDNLPKEFNAVNYLLQNKPNVQANFSVCANNSHKENECNAKRLADKLEDEEFLRGQKLMKFEATVVNAISETDHFEFRKLLHRCLYSGLNADETRVILLTCKKYEHQHIELSRLLYHPCDNVEELLSSLRKKQLFLRLSRVLVLSGLMYYLGDGLYRNNIFVSRYFRLAMSMGYSDALVMTGIRSRRDSNSASSLETPYSAQSCFIAAAEAKNREAVVQLSTNIQTIFFNALLNHKVNLTDLVACGYPEALFAQARVNMRADFCFKNCLEVAHLLSRAYATFNRLGHDKQREITRDYFKQALFDWKDKLEVNQFNQLRYVYNINIELCDLRNFVMQVGYVAFIEYLYLDTINTHREKLQKIYPLMKSGGQENSANFSDLFEEYCIKDFNMWLKLANITYGAVDDTLKLLTCVDSSQHTILAEEVNRYLAFGDQLITMMSSNKGELKVDPSLLEFDLISQAYQLQKSWKRRRYDRYKELAVSSEWGFALVLRWILGSSQNPKDLVLPQESELKALLNEILMKCDLSAELYDPLLEVNVNAVSYPRKKAKLLGTISSMTILNSNGSIHSSKSESTLIKASFFSSEPQGNVLIQLQEITDFNYYYGMSFSLSHSSSSFFYARRLDKVAIINLYKETYLFISAIKRAIVNFEIKYYPNEMISSLTNHWRKNFDIELDKGKKLLRCCETEILNRRELIFEIKKFLDSQEEIIKRDSFAWVLIETILSMWETGELGEVYQLGLVIDEKNPNFKSACRGFSYGFVQHYLPSDFKCTERDFEMNFF